VNAKMATARIAGAPLRLIDAVHRALALGAAALLFGTAAHAELGGNAASTQADQQHMKGALHVHDYAGYSVHEIQTASATVNEYVTPSGVVFGVAWRGRAMPDLRQLLGAHFAEYTESAKSQHSGHGRLTIQNPSLVVHSSGHMRAFFGRAYIPQLVPPTVSVEEIQ
jgi:hypothetical protein